MITKRLFIVALMGMFSSFSAQNTYTQDFEDQVTGSTTFPSGWAWYLPNSNWTVDGVKGQNAMVYEDEILCGNGVKGFGQQYNGNSGTRDFKFKYVHTAKSTGQAITINVVDRFKNLVNELEQNNVNYQIMYLGKDRGSYRDEVPLYASSSSNFNLDSKCETRTLTIPAYDPNGTINNNGIKPGDDIVIIFSIGTYNGTKKFQYVLDKISFTQAAQNLPQCATNVILPNNVAPNASTPPSVRWQTTPEASGYKLYLGTSPGNYNLIDGETTTLLYKNLTTLSPLTTYYFKIVPFNTTGDAVGCTEYSFTTEDTEHCLHSITTLTTEHIKNVKLKDMNQATELSNARYHNYYPTNSVVVAQKEQLALTVTAYGGPNNTSDYTFATRLRAYIDWNNDKTFSENETYVFDNLGSTLTNYTRQLNITVPENANLGNVRMRILLSNNGNPQPCGTSTRGQVHDYKLIVEEFLGAENISKKKVTLAPNPFSDIVKISDIEGVKSISVIDITGRVVKTLTPSSEINLSSLKSGMYIINLMMEDGSVKTIKSVKK